MNLLFISAAPRALSQDYGDEEDSDWLSILYLLYYVIPLKKKEPKI